jgi:hypothetical protein
MQMKGGSVSYDIRALDVTGLTGPRGRPGKPGTNGTPGIPGINAWTAKVNGTNSNELLIPPSVAGEYKCRTFCALQHASVRNPSKKLKKGIYLTLLVFI